MSKKRSHLISFILVLVLVIGVAEGVDPDLVGWWRFEEGSGTIAYDSSGNGLDGTLVGGATWTQGRFGGGLELDGTSGYVSVPEFELTTDSITFVIWLNGWKGGDWAPLISSRVVGQCEMIFGNDDTLRYVWNNDSSATWGWTDGPVIPEDTWTMLAVTIDPEKAVAYVYTDDGGLIQSTNAIPHIEETVGALQIGYSYDPRYIRGIIDEAAVFNRALTEPEILGLVSGVGEEYPYASGSSPKDGSLIMDTWVNLSWRAGAFAVSHDVYIGDNFDAVSEGAEGTFIGNQGETFIVVGFPGFPYPDGLVPGTTYYWRIDEVNDTEPNSPWKGDVWSFSIPPKTAYFPDPADSAESVALDAELSWTPGFGAKLHTVYFGDNFDDVSNADGGLPQGAATYTPGPLEMAKTYYWRVDEFDVVETHKGNVWSFTTEGAVTALDPVN
ncbi:MAG: LamG domain-containing protein, partial [Planctomycetota bacterium]